MPKNCQDAMALLKTEKCIQRLKNIRNPIKPNMQPANNFIDAPKDKNELTVT